MRTAGYDVEAFASGAAFLASAAQRPPDCLVLDLHMPEMNGFEVQTRLSRSVPALPVVVVTGHDIPEARERVVSAGAAAYLRKPLDAQILLDTIASAIAGAGMKNAASSDRENVG